MRQPRNSVESAIRLELAEAGTCTLDDLTERLPYYSWNQVFTVVDQLSRQGTVTLQRSKGSGYILSLASACSIEAGRRTSVESLAHT
jgi:hypothetical protein